MIKKIFFLVVVGIIVLSNYPYAQRVGFIASNIIREKFPEAIQAEQRIRSIVEEWKREIEEMERAIENLKFEINKNRLIWTDEEKKQKEKDLEDLITQKLSFSRKKFEPGGEYDMIVKTIMQPIEDKIYAAVQKVSAENGFDIIWDKSTQPLAYVNYKYDLTLKVLRELGVDVTQMEKELQEKISKDPRNVIKVESPAATRRKQRTPTKREVEQKEVPQPSPELEETEQKNK
ncbi:MAG: OmpH family outer membrane protein [Ignavibacteria bacterium]|nr:OmpH family outer membrane protein [Ignavibacteria bacterium]